MRNLKEFEENSAKGAEMLFFSNIALIVALMIAGKSVWGKSVW